MANPAKRDPICGMEGKYAAHGEVFCSLYCVDEFEKKNNLPKEIPNMIRRVTWTQILNALIAASTAFVLIAPALWPSLLPLKKSLAHYYGLMLPAFALGIILAGLIDVFVPREIISRLLGQGGIGDVLRGSALGIAASACSHGCLAISIELYKKGASPAAFTSFLLASPWASLPTTILLLRLFGSPGAIIVIMAIIVSITTGLGIAYAASRGWLPANPNLNLINSKGSWKELLRRNLNEIETPANFLLKFKNASLSLLGMTLPWVGLGILISAVAGSYLTHWIHGYMGKGLWGPLTSLAASTAVEVCSEGSSPIAFEIYKNTAALGSAFIFLEAGIITDFTELSLVAANTGRRTALALVLLSVPQALLIAYLLNAF